MAKYLTEFNTYAEYSAATLSLPNVSLIKSTGKVYYKNVFAGATIGDILMYDNVNNKLVTTFGGNWSTEMFPIAQYEPIAINIYPADQASDGKSRYMALKWASNTSDTGKTSNVNLVWGNNSTTAGDITSTDQTALNGRENTDKALELADGTTANTQAAFAAFAAVNRFRTNGTSAGDWYLPSKAELSLYQANYADINTNIQAIKNASSSIVNTVNYNQWTSTEATNIGEVWNLYSGGVFSDDNRNYQWVAARGIIAL
jgi:hypothetical protein